MYKELTQGIQVTVEPRFLDAESDPARGYYFWAYTIEILNLSTETVQLCGRHWQIVSDDGQAQTVDGQGVVGEQPVLAPGESFEYTSGAPLPTPSGFMHGYYQMEKATGQPFDVAVPAFSLDSPHARRSIN